MAKVDDVKDAIAEVVPGAPPRRGRRLPRALLVAAVAGAAAWASRLEPVRSAIRSFASTVRARVAAMTGRAEEAAPSGTPAVAATPSLESSGSTMDGMTADAPVGIGFDDASTASPAMDDAAGIPADSEEGRPAGV